MANVKLVTILITSILIMTLVSGCIGNDSEEGSLGALVIAYEIKDNTDNIDSNPQIFADYLSEKLNYDVSLFSVDSEGAMTRAPRLPSSLSLPIQPETRVIIKIEVIRIVTSLTLAILTHHLRIHE